MQTDLTVDFTGEIVPTDEHNDAMGIEANYRAITKAVGAFRQKAAVDGSWSEEINEDYNKRK